MMNERVWEPLADGEYQGRADIDNGRISESGSITIKGNNISVYEYSFGAEREAHVAIDKFRLCRQVEVDAPAAAAVPDEVREVMVYARDMLWKIGTDESVARGDVLSGWLDEQWQTDE